MKLILHGGGEDGIGSKREELSKSLIRKITPTIGMLQYLFSFYKIESVYKIKITQNVFMPFILAFPLMVFNKKKNFFFFLNSSNFPNFRQC
jgi:hypothetical protein